VGEGEDGGEGGDADDSDAGCEDVVGVVGIGLTPLSEVGSASVGLEDSFLVDAPSCIARPASAAVDLSVDFHLICLTDA
jgi:hypothetical protein